MMMGFEWGAFSFYVFPLIAFVICVVWCAMVAEGICRCIWSIIDDDASVRNSNWVGDNIIIGGTERFMSAGNGLVTVPITLLYTVVNVISATLYIDGECTADPLIFSDYTLAGMAIITVVILKLRYERRLYKRVTKL